MRNIASWMVLAVACQAGVVAAQDRPTKSAGSDPPPPAAQQDPFGPPGEPGPIDPNDPFAPPRSKDPPGLKRLSAKYDLWVDMKRKAVVVEGYVCLRQGPLEMFACPQGTKEHESIVALNCKAFQLHAALIAVGAKPGHPVVFDPQYVPATGTEIKVEVLWKDAQGKQQRVPAQQWIKDHATGKPLSHAWVFGGSAFWKDPDTKKNLYLAEDGDLICVSNFTTATLDLPIKSSADAGSLVFVANTEKIPAQKTVVRLVLTPVVKQDAKPGSKQDKPDAKQEAPQPKHASNAADKRETPDPKQPPQP